MTNILYDGFHKIEEVNTTIKGKKVTRERLRLPSAVGGLVINQVGHIALVTQYRPTIEQYTKEIPAGILDKGVSSKETLLQELEEECEIHREDIIEFSVEPFAKYFMVTGSSNAEMELYAIQVKNQGYETKTIVDDHDVESVEWVSLERFKDYINNGQVVDSKSLLAYEQAFKIIKN